MKILIIQLPLLDHGWSYIAGNIEYAAASQIAFIKHNFPEHEIESLPFVLSNFASNEIICKYAERISPDIIAFSAYLWNVEREINIAESLKLSRPKLEIIFGGPEIQADCWALSEKRSCVDLFVSGEGEWFWKNYFENKDSITTIQVNGNNLAVQNKNEVVKVEDMVEPFTAGYLNSMLDGSIFIELIRGCPYGCVYCNYSRNISKLREYDFVKLLEAIDRAEFLGLTEIYILAPTFSSSPDFKLNLERLAEFNEGSSIRLHTELRADHITNELAQLLYKAGFRSLEVGLQTMTPAALEAVHRITDSEKELAGILALKKAGIEIQVGIIPGLPSDTPQEFFSMLERLLENNLSNEIELYPLMVLPGTKIREMADNDGAVYQKLPPYYLESGWNFELDDLIDLNGYLQDETGFSRFQFRLPNFIYKADGILNQGTEFEYDKLALVNDDANRLIIDGSVQNIFITLSDSHIFKEEFKIFMDMLYSNDALFNVVFVGNSLIDNNELLAMMQKLDRDNFYRRLHLFEEWSDGLRIKFYQLFDDVTPFNQAHAEYTLIDPLVKITDTKDFSFLDLKGDMLPSLLVSSGSGIELIKKLVKTYKEDADKIAFEDEESMTLFYEKLDIPLQKLPFNFRKTVLNF